MKQYRGESKGHEQLSLVPPMSAQPSETSVNGSPQTVDEPAQIVNELLRSVDSSVCRRSL